MEVHMHGLPRFLADKAVEKELEPFMAKLGIPQDAFICEKYKRQKWANITFHKRLHGQAFMNSHGEELDQHKPPQNGPRNSNTARSGRNSTSISTNASVAGATASAFRRKPHNQRHRGRSRLHLAGKEIFCSLSKNPNDPRAVAGQPNPITLRALKYTAEEKANPTRNVVEEDPPEVLNLVSLNCGYNVFDGDRLVFVPEVEIRDTGTAKFSKHTLLIKLKSGHIVRISLDTIVSLVCSFDHTFNLTLSEGPSFFHQSNPEKPSTSRHIDPEMENMLDLMKSVFVNDLSGNKEPERTRVCSLNEQHAKVVGHCLVYQFQVTGSDLHRPMRTLKNHHVVPFVRFPIPTLRMAPQQFGCSEHAMHALLEELASVEKARLLPFGILFHLQALAFNAYLHPSVVLSLLKELLRKFKSDRDTGRQPISLNAMRMLFKEIDWPKPHGDPSDFQVTAIIALLLKRDKEARGNISMQTALLASTRNLASIYRATVTPTRITLHGPELEVKNRILRKYPKHHEYFLRVQFCDENGQDLFYNAKVDLAEVWDRFKHVFSTGIQIAGRIYGFLGFSHSSLRSHSTWFRTNFSIIKALGQFSKIRSPARCAARIGQAFSETPFSISLDEHGIKVKDIEDVTSEDGTRVFSDGVGTLTWDVIDIISDILPQKANPPTAYQIRCRGTKGMIAVDSRSNGSVIRFRPSMTKFASDDDRVLEICDMASKPIPLVLNRQMIKILEDMGNTELKRIREVMTDTDNVAGFLKHKKIAENIRFDYLFRQAAKMGVDWQNDHFMCSVVKAVVFRELRLLKHKARIPVENGITLFGIMDETGFLKENEVYVTYDRCEERFPPPPTRGRVLVTRSPALHPGDIQAPLLANPPNGHPLRDHMNVIVFSRHGTHDLPSQLSGGDLDGDIYNVIWDEQARRATVFAPADYPRVAPVGLDREVTKEDMADFFIDFMKSDHLGVIATRHMILADQRDTGTLHDDCLTLSRFHSTAVDYSKTGLAVDLKELPRAERYRPDFLAPGGDVHVIDKSDVRLDDNIVEPAADAEEDQFSPQRHRYYRSDKILGQLYRAVDEKKIWREDVQSKFQPRSASFWDDFLIAIRPRYQAIVDQTEGYVFHMKTARDIRGWYEDAVSNAMNQYSEHPINPITELEVFTGNIHNKSGIQTHRQRDQSIKLKDEFGRICDWITGLMRKVSRDSHAPLTGYETEHDSLHLCLACVYVGNEKSASPDGSRYENMQSFRVVAACALLSELSKFDRGHVGGGYPGVRSRGVAAGCSGK
ncbi:RdRP-domain-containing protein [Cryphonectria parasitica EP155]|uniref:RNA-dependent RNA polymerase n=1 Tax=Cryphonectria parasitica (strain ATCC 38755 / EP155) TaxID=660469 RepID=A0A9P4Y4E0_CRYP1|nr:RdRP-domain-containing protein [Cryphonectria parasitica EP155]KAF3766441.1 RdRP-domain-containing protein [Cryphonectria parasitica EP155]